MAKWSVLLLALFAGAAYSTDSSRIIGGQTTSIQQHPSLVQIDDMSWIAGVWTQNCAGNILTSRHVLSAANCFHGPLYHSTRRRIRAGTSTRESGGRILHVDKVTNHPSFNATTMDGDISIIQLTSAFTFTRSIQRATIVNSGFVAPNNIQVLLAGWGDTTTQGLPSPQLREVSVFTVDRTRCAEAYATLNRTVTSNMICSGMLSIGGRGACTRDTGGPMYLGGTIIGIISWTHECGHGVFPGVSTSISPYTEWVRETAVL